MKKIAILVALATVFALMPTWASAQNNDEYNHGSVGVFMDYLRLERTNRNMFGLGGRAGFNVHPNVQLEGEIAWDFSQDTTEICTGCPPVPAIPPEPSSFRVLHGVFGLKIQKTGNIRPFLLLKGGFDNWRIDNRPVTFGTFGGSLDDLRANNMHGVFYPGAGVEFYAGPIGLRIEAGDHMYFQDGAHHNLRLTVGPQFRF